jgi:hypothetical protein
MKFVIFNLSLKALPKSTYLGSVIVSDKKYYLAKRKISLHDIVATNSSFPFISLMILESNISYIDFKILVSA